MGCAQFHNESFQIFQENELVNNLMMEIIHKF
jgi:hypothetical protein